MHDTGIATLMPRKFLVTLLLLITMEKKIVETFRDPRILIRDAEQKEPSCFNGWVRVKKYRITVEEVVEPVDVIAERLQKLWDDCDNHHNWQPLKNAADSIGYTLLGEVGKNRKR